ncbi:MULTISPECIES: phosphorylase [Sphingomonas]|uniref:Phosphorylase n=1 Tax=Edaphosphingomonas fennica TaxID=114404 RepID=A0A2T4HXM7_9SPHN|nr:MULTISPECIES: phosphorylase [Sphingomonas]MDX3885527.1 phosphorylase [Sphingomonas sp.]PTD20457.1 phosphorylase [Sphingomonas fennica]
MTILVATGLKREARIIARDGLAPIPGGGDAAALEAALEAHARSARAIWSMGIAGGLAPDLAVGDWTIGGDPATVEALARRLPEARIGEVHADGTLVAEAAAKRALHAGTGAIIVDMESHVAARVAARHGLPFAFLRVISDTADHDLPHAAWVGMQPGGGMAIGPVTASLARNPGQLPALIRTARDVGAAFRSLERLMARMNEGERFWEQRQ